MRPAPNEVTMVTPRTSATLTSATLRSLVGLGGLLFLFFLLVVPSQESRAQSLALFSRNHPELDWRVATTDHFEIVHPARLDSIAARAAPIAETTYDSLATALDTTFSERIQVVLTDQDDIANGFAALLSGGAVTDIWVHPTDWATKFSEPSPWLRTVLSHELVHLFHARAVSSDLGALEQLGIPGFWSEGLAQYQAETWNAQRGERWLRAAVLDDNLDYDDGQSLWNGRLLYASGHSQVRYFAQQHGDSTLTQMLHHRSERLFGLLETHDFETAFRETTGQPYDTFREQWRRDMNVYYNTLAGQIETLDSLRTDTLRVPGRGVLDLKYSPDTSRVAALVELSPERPVRRLYVIDRSAGERHMVAEGPIEPPVAWHPSGRQLAFSRRARGPSGSVIDDLFLVGAGGSGERRLTRGRRTTAPTFSPDGDRLAFAGSEDGTANIYAMTLPDGEPTRITDYAGNIEVTGLSWHPTQDTLALTHVGPEGGRTLRLYDMAADTAAVLTGPSTDDQRPTWSPGGTKLAYTSLRDGVPNAFVQDVERGTRRRATRLVRGATVHDWVPVDSAFGAAEASTKEAATEAVPGEALAVSTTLSKTEDGAFLIPAGHRADSIRPSVPQDYAAWRAEQPPHPIPTDIPPDPSLIRSRGDYNSWTGLTNRFSFGLPYYFSPGSAGIAGLTSWVEPTGQHALNAGGNVSVVAPLEDSEVFASYTNRQFAPTVNVSLFSASSSGRIYGNDLLVQEQTGGSLRLRWPLDWWARPYTSTALEVRLRYVDLTPLDRSEFVPGPGALQAPRGGQQASVRLQWTRRHRPPYRHTLVHPLDGWGLRLRGTAAGEVLGGDSSFLRGDLMGYGVLPGLGDQRLFLHGRVQAQTGSPFPQDYLGFSRYDAIELPALSESAPFTLGDADRVRGYRSYALGTRLAFGSAEYRIPLAQSLGTKLLGLVSLGRTTVSGFLDGGGVWTGADLDGATWRAGAGVELKNALSVGGLRIGHALGAGRSVLKGDGTDWNVYYRVQTALPF
jgi:WD40 repeat protein